MRLRSRTDANHTAILDVFRAAGWWVLDLHRQGGGCADALVVDPARYSLRIISQGRLPQLIRVNRTYMVELKVPKTGRLNRKQQDFAARCPLPYRVIRTIDEALALVGGR